MAEIQIGSHVLEIPLIQGGMGIGVSRSRLAGAVAAEGAMGVISAAQVGYDEPDFEKDPLTANIRALKEQIRRARERSGGRGLIGVNLMTAVKHYGEYARAACEAEADAIISGAGLPVDLPIYVSGSQTAVAPIVSSARSAEVILKYWDRKHRRTADFLVIEGPKAGGHLGFSREELQTMVAADFDQEIQKILEVRKSYENKYGCRIPVFTAGGIFTAEDTAHAMALGADGVQAATRFVTTWECDAHEAYKEAYLRAEPEDVVITVSPVGMPGRAILNSFLKRIRNAPEKITHCYGCLKGCNPAKAPYCITKALIRAVEGKTDQGLIFCGERVGELKEITTVRHVIRDLMGMDEE